MAADAATAGGTEVVTTALITGATGFLGAEILASLLAADPDVRFVALIRARSRVSLARRRQRLVANLPVAHAARVAVVHGDMTLPRLGLSALEYEALVAHVDRVIHVAATTSFTHPLGEARRQNVGGTAEALAFCRRLVAGGKSGRLDYVSTAYVAGDRTGTVGEDELDVGQGFRNTYEQSKLEAEALCRAASAELPIAIHRPSIIVGHSVTGATSSWKALYVPMRLIAPFYLRWPALTRFVPLPLERNCPLDVVPVDWVASAVATLYGRPEAAGRCHHLAAGPEGSVTSEKAIALACAFFGGPPRRFLAPTAPVSWLARAARPLARRLWPRAVAQVEQCLPYAFDNPRFDTTHRRAAGLEPPPFASYFPRVLAYAARRGFGHAVADATDRAGAEKGAGHPVAAA